MSNQIYNDPLELVSRFVNRHEWLLHRTERNVILAEVPSRWGVHRLSVTWDHETEALLVLCTLDIAFNKHRETEVLDLACMLNEHLWLGHFIVNRKEQTIQIRYNLPLRGVEDATAEQIEEVVDVLLGEAEESFPAFYHVVEKDINAQEASVFILAQPLGTA